MNLFTAIETRKSSRRFSNEPIDEDTLFNILKYANLAPSAGNARPWRFIVLCTPDILKQAAAIHPQAAMADKAPCAVVVAGDLFKETQSGFWVQDCAACTNTMLLAAHGMGLGALWTGIYPIKQRVEKFSRMLNVPKSVIPFSMVLLGHSNVRPPDDPVEFDKSSVFFNTFGTTEFPE
ncbi:MAG: nitroreductase family protein [Deltaproteobacteria bacterium]|nr:nitroreductase family protein [Deltaproteobacteria bacterium]MBN2672533.1 nitroreductase family protein [Deltaproteobacteria bacterium]